VDVYSPDDVLTSYEKSADVICLLYDATNPNSFAYCANIYLVRSSPQQEWDPALDTESFDVFCPVATPKMPRISIFLGRFLRI